MLQTHVAPLFAAGCLLLAVVGCVPGSGVEGEGEGGEGEGEGEGAAPPSGIFLWTGAGGGGPGSDLYLQDFEGLYTHAGVDVADGASLTADFTTRFGTLVYVNPQEAFDSAVDAAATDLLARGGRVVLISEHDGFGNQSAHNTFLAAAGASMRLKPNGGTAFDFIPLDVTPHAPLTDGVSSLVSYGSGDIDVQGADVIGKSGAFTVVAAEHAGAGEIVVVADSTMFGFALGNGDNNAFIVNLAAH